jgi:biotin--protein ligase
VTSSTQIIIEENFQSLKQGILYVTDIQTSGIGRTGAWESPLGCLMFSYKFSCNANVALAVQMIIPLAIVNAIISFGREKGVVVEDLKIKWPNDVYLKSRKLAGILVNSKSHGKEFNMVIGIGINVNNTGKNISLEEVFPKIFTRGAVLKHYLIEFEKLVYGFNREGWEERLVEEYQEKWISFGKKVFIRGNVEGVAIGINHQGVIAVKDCVGMVHEIAAREDIDFRLE